jgi:translation elongation factor EF-1alpha
MTSFVGVTIDIAQRNFCTNTKEFTILDSPGHRDFMPNMISGCCSADVALLVVPAATGEFESSIAVHAQTRELATILKSMGVNQVLVAVNKMDCTSPAWDIHRYEYIQTEMVKLLLELNFSRKAIRFVPLSGLHGENIIDVSPATTAALAWYQGGTLMDALDAFKIPPRLVARPLRAIVNSVIGTDSKGVEVSVTVVQGRVRCRRSVSLVTSELVEVRSITSSGATSSCDALYAGEQGVLSLAYRCASYMFTHM